MDDWSIAYSFGGTAETPLVARRVAMRKAPPDASPVELQALCLERTDLILEDLCAVFDAAEARARETACADGASLTIMLGACMYAVAQILAPSPSVRFMLFATRVQRLQSLIPDVTSALGPAAAAALRAALEAPLRQLESMAAPFLEHNDPTEQEACSATYMDDDTDVDMDCS